MNVELTRQSKVQNYFSDCSEYWESLYSSNNDDQNWIKYEISHRKELILSMLDHVGLNHLHVALDIGCGAGNYLLSLATKGLDCVGVDVSDEMLRRTRQKLKSHPEAVVELLNADCCSLPMDDDSFGLILCIGVLEYLEDESLALKEIKRLISPRGRVIVTLPNLFKLRNIVNPYYYFVRIWTYLFRRKKRSRSSNQSFSFGLDEVSRYSLFNARKIIKKAGFRVLKAQGCCFGPFSLWKQQVHGAGRAIKMSNRLEQLLDKKGFGFLNMFANRWILLLEPDDLDGAAAPQS